MSTRMFTFVTPEIGVSFTDPEKRTGRIYGGIRFNVEFRWRIFASKEPQRVSVSGEGEN